MRLRRATDMRASEVREPAADAKDAKDPEMIQNLGEDNVEEKQEDINTLQALRS